MRLPVHFDVSRGCSRMNTARFAPESCRPNPPVERAKHANGAGTEDVCAFRTPRSVRSGKSRGKTARNVVRHVGVVLRAGATVSFVCGAVAKMLNAE